MEHKRLATIVDDCAGAVLLEFALVLPALLLLSLGIFEFGLTFREYLVVTNAAREGARMAVLPGYSDDDVKARVRNYLTQAGGLRPDVIVEPQVTTGPPVLPADANYAVKTVTARVNHSFAIISPVLSLFGGSQEGYGTLALKAVSVMRVEVAAEATP